MSLVRVTCPVSLLVVTGTMRSLFWLEEQSVSLVGFGAGNAHRFGGERFKRDLSSIPEYPIRIV